VRNGRIVGGEIAHEFATSALLPELERKLVADALQRARGSESRAAKILRLTRAQIYTRMKRFGLNG